MISFSRLLLSNADGLWTGALFPLLVLLPAVGKPRDFLLTDCERKQNLPFTSHQVHQPRLVSMEEQRRVTTRAPASFRCTLHTISFKKYCRRFTRLDLHQQCLLTAGVERRYWSSTAISRNTSRDDVRSEGEATLHKSEPEENQGDGGAGSDSATREETRAEIPHNGLSHPRFRVVRLHNLPRNWLYDEVLEFIDQIAQHAGIEPPPARESKVAQAEEVRSADTESDPTEGRVSDSASLSTSPFVEHITLYFGRRTGVVYGAPRLVLNSSALCEVLVQGLQLDSDDYRSRIYFTEDTKHASEPTGTPSESVDSSTSPEGGDNHRSAGMSFLSLIECSALRQHCEAALIAEQRERNNLSFSLGNPKKSALVLLEESMLESQRTALEQMELDRYLFAPDLLYDIERLHQRRRLTNRESVLLDSFMDGNEDGSRHSPPRGRPQSGESREVEEGPGKPTPDPGTWQERGTDLTAEGEERHSTTTSHSALSASASAAPVHQNRTKKKKQARLARESRVMKLLRRRHFSAHRLAGEQSHLGRGSMENTPIPKPYVQGRRV